MSLLAFQRALADLASSAELCSSAIHSPEDVLDSYSLTERERKRLMLMARDPLMATNCALYRANRITPIFMFLPWTCRLLGPDLRRELDAFWSAEPAVDLQYLAETDRFAKFIKQRVQQGIVSGPYVREIVGYETSVMNLRFADRPQGAAIKLVHFSHEPLALLSSLERPEPIPESLPVGHYVVSLEVRGEILEIRTLTSSACEGSLNHEFLIALKNP